jgi:hypothetical protein
MRFAALVTVLLVAAPAFAQTPKAAAKDDPPPEGFYRDIPNAYDLLARLETAQPVTLIFGQRILPKCPAFSEMTDAEKIIVRRPLGSAEFYQYRNAEGKQTACVVPQNKLPPAER